MIANFFGNIYLQGVRSVKIGYIRISKHEQNYDLQMDALKAYGCEKYFVDKVSGRKEDRKELRAAIDFSRPGDTIVVWRLDRLGRSLQHLIRIVNDFKNGGVEFASTTESVDTSTPTGKFFFHLTGALAEFEVDIVRERTKAGLASARARGRKGGRPKALTNEQEKQLIAMSKDKALSVKAICDTFGIAKATYYKYINEAKSK